LIKESDQGKYKAFYKERGETILTSGTSLFSDCDQDISKFKLNKTGVEFTTLKKRTNIKSAPPYEIKEILGLADKINLKYVNIM
jgi:hypothetical protein